MSTRDRGEANVSGGVACRAFACGAAAGWLAGYFLDPDRGRQRRALARDKTLRLRRDAAHALAVVQRDAEQRGRGLVARARSRVRHEPVPDEVLLPRLRAELGRRVAHPHAVEVRVEEGRVTLEGEVGSREVQPLVRALRRSSGVRSLENRLAVRAGGDSGPEHVQRAALARSWSPAGRLVAAAAGATWWLVGARRRSAGRFALTLGTLLVARALGDGAREPRAGRAEAGGRAEEPTLAHSHR